MRFNTTMPLILFMAVYFATVVGCGSFRDMPVEKQVVISYEVMGETLQAAKASLVGLCATGEISKEDCTKARAAYNNAVNIYQLLGEMAKATVDTGDSTSYRELAIQLMDVLTYLQTYTGGPK